MNFDLAAWRAKYGATPADRGERLANATPFGGPHHTRDPPPGWPGDHRLNPPPPGHIYVTINLTTEFATVRSQRWREAFPRTYRVHVPTAMLARAGDAACTCPAGRLTRLCKHVRAVREAMDAFNNADALPDGARVV